MAGAEINVESKEEETYNFEESKIGGQVVTTTNDAIEELDNDLAAKYTSLLDINREQDKTIQF